MEITVFAKRRTNKEGKIFYQYITTLEKKDGSTETIRVCFRGVDAPKPESCPRNIVTAKDNANIATRKYTTPETGEIKSARTLWLSAWEPGSEYVDHSMDDYNI